MDFVELTKRSNRDLHDTCDRGDLQQIGRAMDRAGGLKKLLLSRDRTLEPFSAEQLHALSQVHRASARWKEAARELRKELAMSGLKLPDGSLQKSSAPNELSALGRAARMCPRSGHQDHDGWSDAVDAHVDLWRACLSVGLSSGHVAIAMIDPDHAEAQEFETHVTTRATFDEIRGYQWLGARRGEHAKILEIRPSVDTERLLEQAVARLPSLGLASQQRGAPSVLEELVLDNIDAALLARMDRRAEDEALGTAIRAYSGLLNTPPLEAETLVAIHVGSTTAPVGIALLDKKGEPLHHWEIAAEEDLPAAIARIVEEHQPAAAVLPVSAADDSRLRAAGEAVLSLAPTRILQTALREARKDIELPPMVAGAVVIGRRALSPSVEFGKVPPAALGLGEYSSDIDHERLTQVLDEARLTVVWERATAGKSARPRKRAATPGKPGRAVKRLNPLVKTIRDLKPGMTLDGVVTNLTRFGAFVNVGLSTEAMIHVSQLSTEFIDEPSQVVRVGQNVNARVIEVVPEKSRIALSLKPAPEPGDRHPRGDDGGERAPRRPATSVPLDIDRRGTPKQAPKNPMESRGAPRRDDGGGDKKSRSAALADLDALFKK